MGLSLLRTRLQSGGRPVLLDGGIGTELQRAGVSMDSNAWSAVAMLSDPVAVRATHEAYIRAGAEVITTNTFSAARHMLEPAGYASQLTQLNQTAVKLAKEAIENVALHPVAIAGSICEWVHHEDSAWNHPDAVASSVEEQTAILLEAGVDLINIEMCQIPEFSIAVIETVAAFGVPYWIGISAQQHKNFDHLSTFHYPTTSFNELVSTVSEYPAMLLNIMHTPVPDVAEAVRLCQQQWKGPIGVYPESGYFEMPHWQFVEIIDPSDLIQAAQNWVDLDIRLLGGCCGINPTHIAALREYIDKKSTDNVII